jgi:hypothetical protein
MNVFGSRLKDNTNGLTAGDRAILYFNSNPPRVCMCYIVFCKVCLNTILDFI